MSKIATALHFLSEWIGAPGWKQTKTNRRAVVTAFVLLGLLALILVVKATAAWIVAPVSTPEDGERFLFALAATMRLKLALVLIPLGLLSAWLAYMVLDRSRLGARLIHWAEKDTKRTEEAKTRNAGLIFSAILASVFMLLAQVVR